MITYSILAQLTIFCVITLEYLANFDDSPVCCKPKIKLKERGHRTRSVGHCYSCEGNHCEHTLYPPPPPRHQNLQRIQTFRNQSCITEQNNNEPQLCADNRTAARQAVSPLRTDTKRSLRGTEEITYRRGASRHTAPLLVRPINNTAAKMAGDAHDGAV